MFGKGGNFFGLRGTQLQIAVGVVAGTDFLLFGYVTASRLNVAW